jgi:hypothetical protein
VRTNLIGNTRGVNLYGDYSGPANQTITTVTGIVGHPEGISTANRVSYAANASNPGILVFNGLVANTRYTLSAWVYHETIPTSSGGQGFAMAGTASQPTPPAIVQGVWQRVSWTYTTPATPSYFGFRVASPTSAGSFLITGLLVETSGILNPFFDGGKPAYENFCTNPSFTSGLTNWTSVSAGLTRVTNMGDGAVCEVTQTTAGSGRQSAIYIHPSFFPQATYTVSFDASCIDASITMVRVLLYNTTLATTVHVGASVNLNLVKDGNFSRYTQTIQTTAAFDRVYIDFIGTNIPVGAKAWVDRVTVERGTTPYGFYFEGTGDYTYAWSGTANASTSYQRGNGVTGYSSAFNNRAAAYSSTEWFSNGTKSLRVTPTQPSDGQNTATYAEVNISGLTVGSTYYITAKSYIRAPLTGTLDVNYRRALFPGTQPTSFTQFTTAANTAGVQEYKASFVAAVTNHGIRFMNGAAEGGGDMWWSDIAVTDNQGNYFDGGTIADADYSYWWSGAAHNSISRKSSIPPMGSQKTSTATTLISTHTDPDNSKMLRWATPAYTVAANWRVGLQDVVAWQQIKSNQIYTLLTLYRYNGGWSTSTYNVLLQDGGATNSVIGSIISDTTSDLGSGWKLNRKVFKSGRDANVGTKMYFVMPTVATGALDCSLDIRYAAIYEGRYDGPYIDGSNHPRALAKWDGTSDASTSVAYPPSLNEIAGVPAVQQIGPGTSGNTTVDGFTARSIYIVYEVMDANAAWQVPVYYGINAPVDGLTFQTSSLGSTSMSPRADFTTGNGDVNKGFVPTGSRIPGKRHVLAVSLPQGLTSLACHTNGSPTTGLPVINPGTVGWTNGALRCYTQGTIKSIHALVYYAEHDAATRLAISRYLGALYGAPVA